VGRSCALTVLISALVLRDLLRPEVHPLQYLIPHLGVVHPRLPRMADVYEPLPPRVPVAVEVLVPGLELAKCVPEEFLSLLPGSFVNCKHGGGVYGRHHHARGLEAFGCVRALLGVPEAGSGEVVTEARVEVDLGQEAVRPLASKRYLSSFSARPGS
jgi:hypothetical protein